MTISIRICAVLSAAFLASPAVAQQPATDAPPPAKPEVAVTEDQPIKLDPSLVDACLDNISIARDDGVKADPYDCIGVAASVCMEQPGGESTAGMVDCAGQEYDVWDAMLNESYRDLLARAETLDTSSTPYLPEDSAPDTALRNMQRDWIAYRDSVCLWESRPWDGGTISLVMQAGCLLDEVGKQALRLRAMQHFEAEH